MSIIDITIVVDPVAIIRDHTISSNSSPITLKNYGRGYVFAMTYWNDVNFGTYSGHPDNYGNNDNNEGGYALDIKAEIQDTIRWRMTSLTAGFEYQCFIQSFRYAFGATVISTMKPKIEAVPGPVQNADGSVVAKQVQDYYWETTVVAQGSAGYDVIFSIFDSTGHRVGIFTIDPYIEVPGKSRYALS
ncbi:AidA/PixA family protein [Bordetella genomosp. 9]|uniref:Inclusion body protein n=1 Tax=Bordetella genomosp. 9 TaxID=1416803 RepID=A0A1W6YVH6_9BORD|nr:AidA/PixA family protein [Bordetella genomosp. 9]ARP85021.1 hypothetical protein CAL13_01370 [Bordetella genomosp. 9]